MVGPIDPNAALASAVGHHQAGRVAQAEDLYRQILLANPRQVDALHNLGLILANRGAMDEAIALFKSALETAPSVAQFWFSLIEALIVTGQGDAAANLLDSAKTHKINGPQYNQLAERANALRDPYVAAYQRHLAGDLDGAAALYQTIATTHPRYADSLMMQGLILVQQGNGAHALSYLEQAVRTDPTHAFAYYHWANTERQLGQQIPAVLHFTIAIALDPSLKQAFESLTLSLVATGQLPSARKVLINALRLDPAYAQIHSDLGSIEFLAGDRNAALVSYVLAVALQPDNTTYWYNSATAVSELGLTQQALPLYERALLLSPTFVGAYGNFGAALRLCGQSERAIRYLLAATESDSGNCQAFMALGLSRLDLGQEDEAILAFSTAMVLKPELAAAYLNLSLTQVSPERIAIGKKSLLRALAIDPSLPEANKNYGDALRDTKDWAGAVYWYQKSLCLRVDFLNALCSMGAVLQMQRKPKLALACYERALKIDPVFPEAHFNQSLVHLAEEDFALGWEKYEWRLRTSAAKRKFADAPRWDGTSIPTGSLLVHAEQGFGDTILFARFLPYLSSTWADVILELPDALRSLFESSFSEIRFVSNGVRAPDFDMHSELMSSPWMLRETLNQIPANVPYLKTDPARNLVWRERLSSPKTRVGIVWRGNPRQSRDRFRSSTADFFSRLIDNPDLCVVILQQDARPHELKVLSNTRAEIINVGPDLSDFCETASVINALDLVITVDTSVCHLAGALGARTWTLLEAAPYWCYMSEGETTPWYPTMRLFRQDIVSGWDGLIAPVREAIAARCESN
jgi:tetratricopeptide (TPR) repeat protein